MRPGDSGIIFNMCEEIFYQSFISLHIGTLFRQKNQKRIHRITIVERTKKCEPVEKEIKDSKNENCCQRAE